MITRMVEVKVHGVTHLKRAGHATKKGRYWRCRRPGCFNLTVNRGGICHDCLDPKPREVDPRLLGGK